MMVIVDVKDERINTNYTACFLGTIGICLHIRMDIHIHIVTYKLALAIGACHLPLQGRIKL